MENQTYLTPSQVEELKELGAEFENCVMQYAKAITSYGEHYLSGEFKLISPDQYIELSQYYGDVEKNIEIIPAPSLQELLGLLPKYLICPSNKTINMPLSLSWCDTTQRWYIGYEHAGIDAGFLFSHSNNPLIAAYELLKWLAIAPRKFNQ